MKSKMILDSDQETYTKEEVEKMLNDCFSASNDYTMNLFIKAKKLQLWNYILFAATLLLALLYFGGN